MTGRPDVLTAAEAAGDSELLAAVSRQDARAFAELLKRHHGPVYRVVWRMTRGVDAEDIVQETFLKLWRNPGQVREAAALRGWLMRVAGNATIDRGRKPKPSALDDVPDIADVRAHAGETLERNTAATAVDQAIAALPDRQRLALSLVYFEGLTNIEAASVMEASVEAVESLLSRGRRALKQSLAGQWQELLGSLAGDGA